MIRKLYYKLRYWNVLSLVAKGTDIGQEESYRIIKEYRKIFEILYGKNFVYEVLLNYRVHYKNNKSKIFERYKKIIYTKQKLHKSDIAISVNIIHKFKLSKNETQIIYDVFKRYFKKNLPNGLLKIKAEQVFYEGKNR